MDGCGHVVCIYSMILFIASSQDCPVGTHGCKAVCNDKNNSCCLPGHKLNRNGMLCRGEDVFTIH